MSFATDQKFKEFLERKERVLRQLEVFEKQAKQPLNNLQESIFFELKTFLNHAKKSAYYKEKIEPLDFKIQNAKSLNELLQILPILKREDIQNHRAEMFIKIPGSKDSDYGESKTSGSSGKPVITTKYLPVHNTVAFALQLLDAKWSQRKLEAPMAVFRFNTPAKESKGPLEPYSYLTEAGTTYFRKLSGTFMGESLDFLAEKQIRNISINAKGAKLLLDEQKRNPRPNIKIDQILNFTDPVDQALRTLAKEVFGAKIINRYSTEELGMIAMQCPHADHLHALQFINYLEILDDDDQPCAVGQPGRVVVTHLKSLAMPFIRYEVGDIGVWGQPCQHGIELPVFDPTITRIRDLLTNPDGSVRAPSFGKAKFTEFEGLTDFQTILFNDAIAIAIRINKPLSDEQEQVVKEELNRIFFKDLPVYVFASNQMDWLQLWKRKTFIKVEEDAPRNLDLKIIKKIILENSPQIS